MVHYQSLLILQFTVRTLTGTDLFLYACTHDGTTIAGVKELIQAQEGIPPDEQRLIFAGIQLEDERTLSSYGVMDGAMLHLVLRLRGDIGVFARADELSASSPTAPLVIAGAALGANLLSGPEFPAGVDAREIAAVATAVCNLERNGLAGNARTCSEPQAALGTTRLLSGHACAALVCLVDAAFLQRPPQGELSFQCPVAPSSELASSVAAGSRADDFKLLLGPKELSSAIGRSAGAAAYAALSNLLGSAPDALVIRRTVGTGRWIGWHTDTASRTVQVWWC